MDVKRNVSFQGKFAGHGERGEHADRAVRAVELLFFLNIFFAAMLLMSSNNFPCMSPGSTSTVHRKRFRVSVSFTLSFLSVS